MVKFKGRQLIRFDVVTPTIHLFRVANKYEVIRSEKETMEDQSFAYLCREGDIEAVETAIDNGADVNEEDYVGARTGLMWALLESHNDVVEVLLQHPEIDVNKVDFCGQTAPHFAVARDNEEGLELLLAAEHGVLTSINYRDDWGLTPIMRAVLCNAVNCFHLLLKIPQVDLHTRDDQQRTPEEVRRYVQSWNSLTFLYENLQHEFI